MKNIINADELAKDVPGAEALMERHQEHKVGKVEGHREGISRTLGVDVNGASLFISDAYTCLLKQEVTIAESLIIQYNFLFNLV